ncbi:YqaJ viral recombinase family protein [Clostridium sp. Mt-5]|uniref:YqaJ viral recombinase family protein n=1 Tax=Clostridium moutaii TaxID=3240932 RepID=A0ABV4BSM3_9CLOT
MYKVLAKTKDMSEIKWLKSHQQGIGGSDAGAILGINNYRSPLDVYIDKTQEIVKSYEQSEAAYWGTILEPNVARRFSGKTGKSVRRSNAILQSVEYPFMTANLDREIVGEKALLECKTANAFLSSRWQSEKYQEVIWHRLCTTWRLQVMKRHI